MTDYLPLVTSYDYDAALDEAGQTDQEVLTCSGMLFSAVLGSLRRLCLLRCRLRAWQAFRSGNQLRSGAICRLR